MGSSHFRAALSSFIRRVKLEPFLSLLPTLENQRTASPNSLRILLLGSGDYTAWRLRIQKELMGAGYSVLVMESLEEIKGESLVPKWDRIFEDERPSHFFVVVHKDGKAVGFADEIGWLRDHFGVSGLRGRVILFIENGTDCDRQLSPYVMELMEKAVIGWRPFGSEEQLRRRIKRSIDRLLFEQGGGPA